MQLDAVRNSLQLSNIVLEYVIVYKKNSIYFINKEYVVFRYIILF